MNDQDLIRELKAGNMSAFKDLFDEYSSLVFNVALRMLQNKRDAEDVTQDVFLRAYRFLNHFRGDARISTWLYRITFNLSLNLQRKRNVRRWFSLSTGTGGFGASANDDKEPSISGTSDKNPDAILEQKETERIIQDAINSLPDLQRIALLLHHYEGLSYEEIARVMDVTVSSVESRLHRAKLALAKRLLRLKKEL